MREAGVSVRPAWLASTDFTITGAHATAKRLLAAPGGRPTAIFAASDEMAIGAITAAQELGLHVPYDLSVIGMDGHELGELFGLTTFDQAPARQGAQAARLLLDELESDGAAPQSRIIDPEFVVRRSTAVPRSAR